jgi:hypothetical protein
MICLHSLKNKPVVHVWGRKSRSSVIKNKKSFHLVCGLSRYKFGPIKIKYKIWVLEYFLWWPMGFIYDFYANRWSMCSISYYFRFNQHWKTSNIIIPPFWEADVLAWACTVIMCRANHVVFPWRPRTSRRMVSLLDSYPHLVKHTICGILHEYIYIFCKSIRGLLGT